jgi:Ca2+-binding EF-hand superfamily protein
VWEEPNGKADLNSAFLVYDKNEDGFISLDEFKKAMLTLGEPLSEDDLKELLSVMVIQSDNTINYKGNLFFFLLK